MKKYTALQQEFMKAYAGNDAMLAAVETGKFYAVATMVLGGLALTITTLNDPNGETFPLLFASYEDAEKEMLSDIQDLLEMKNDDEDDEEDDFDLAVVEVLWDGSENFTVDDRQVSLKKIQQGSF